MIVHVRKEGCIAALHGGVSDGSSMCVINLVRGEPKNHCQSARAIEDAMLCGV